MHILFDKQNMDLKVVCGILEKYKPNKNVEKIHIKVDALREKMDQFMKNVVEPELFEINKRISEENEKFVIPEKKSKLTKKEK